MKGIAVATQICRIYNQRTMLDFKLARGYYLIIYIYIYIYCRLSLVVEKLSNGFDFYI